MTKRDPQEPRKPLDNDGLDDEAARRRARRKLLKLAAYSVPVVVGTLTARQASAATCEPNTGCPPNTGCQPNCEPNCGPNICNPSN